RTEGARRPGRTLQNLLAASLRVHLPAGSLRPRRSGPDTGFFRDGAERSAFATGGSEPGKVPFAGAEGIAEFLTRRRGQTSRPETRWRRAIRFVGRLDGRGAIALVDPGAGLGQMVARKNLRCALGGDRGRARVAAFGR